MACHPYTAHVNEQRRNAERGAHEISVETRASDRARHTGELMSSTKDATETAGRGWRGGAGEGGGGVGRVKLVQPNWLCTCWIMR